MAQMRGGYAKSSSLSLGTQRLTQTTMKGLLPYFAMSCVGHGLALALLLGVSLPSTQEKLASEVVLVTLHVTGGGEHGGRVGDAIEGNSDRGGEPLVPRPTLGPGARFNSRGEVNPNPAKGAASSAVTGKGVERESAAGRNPSSQATRTDVLARAPVASQEAKPEPALQTGESHPSRIALPALKPHSPVFLENEISRFPAAQSAGETEPGRPEPQKGLVAEGIRESLRAEAVGGVSGAGGGTEGVTMEGRDVSRGLRDLRAGGGPGGDLTAVAGLGSRGDAPTRGAGDGSHSVAPAGKGFGGTVDVGPGPRPDVARGLLQVLLQRIERVKHYPSGARRSGMEGTVEVEFRIAGDGGVEGVKVVKSSGFTLLDEASVETIRRAAPLPIIPGTIRVPISYRLRDGQ